jgi:hypothetical protein
MEPALDRMTALADAVVGTDKDAEVENAAAPVDVDAGEERTSVNLVLVADAIALILDTSPPSDLDTSRLTPLGLGSMRTQDA